MKKSYISIAIGTLLTLPLVSYALDEVTATGTQKEGATSTEVTNTPAKLFTLCSQEAIEKRDTELAASRSSYNVAMNNALNERKVREKSAVAQKNEADKKTAIKASVENYKTQVKQAQTVLTQARKTIWQTFEQDVALCRESKGSDQEQASDVKEVMSLKKIEKGEGEKTEKKDEESKSIKETLKAQLESIRALFN